MSANEIKVTDKRMFTEDGELRESFRHLDEAPAPRRAEEERSPSPPHPAEPSPEPPKTPPPVAPPGPDATLPPRPEVELPPSSGEAPGFMDLVAMLAEPVLLYLGQARLPDGSSAENPDAARAHIDLLGLLQEKTEGNLDGEERAMLEDVLYQLRMGYVRRYGPGR